MYSKSSVHKHTRARARSNENEVIKSLHSFLSKHMVPSIFQLSDEMPTTSSGKINRLELMMSAIEEPVSDAPAPVPMGGMPEQSALKGASDMSNFLVSDEVNTLKRLGVDSLGIARRYFSLVQDLQVAAWELQVADGVRAICMFRVIVDHFASCMPGNSCQGFHRAITIPHNRQDLDPDPVAMTSES